MYTIKKILIIILILIIIGAVVLSIKYKKEPVIIPIPIDKIETPDINIADEKSFVEKYIRENIGTLATDEPVLGGSWYVVFINLDTASHSGEVIYEDGHIESRASITYSYQESPQSVTVTKWEVLFKL